MKGIRPAAVTAGAVVLVGLGGVSGAVGSSLITSRDVLDHSLRQRDLTPAAVTAFKHQGLSGLQTIQETETVLPRDVDPGPDVWDPPGFQLFCPDGKVMLSHDTAVDDPDPNGTNAPPVFAWTVQQYQNGYGVRVDNQTSRSVDVTLYGVCVDSN